MIANGRIQLYPVLRLVLMLALGIIAGDALCRLCPVWCWFAAVAAVMVVALCLRRHAVAQSCTLLVAVFLLGCALVNVERHGLSPVISGSVESYEAVVMTPPVQRGKTVRCEILVSKGRLAGHRVRASFLCTPRDGRAAALRVGDGVVAASKFEVPVSGKSVSSHFDYARWLHVQGVSCTTFLYYDAWKWDVIDLSSISAFNKIRLRAMRFRERIVGKWLRGTLPDQGSAVVAAMTLGDKSQLSAATKQAYSVSGASHILALSGLHLGIICAFLSLVFVRGRRRWAGQLVVKMSLWTYVVIVGMMPSIVRSATMFTFYAAASMLRRPQLSLNAWAFAAFVILMVSPLSLWDVGFQLSFMAVAGIMVLYRPIYGVVNAEWLLRHRLLKWVWGLTVVSFSAQLAVAPLLAFYFGRFSCYFLLANLVAVPLAAFVLYASLIAVLFTPLPWLQSWIFKGINVVAGLMNDALSWFSRLPGASIEDIRINEFQVAMLYIMLACMYFLACYAVRLHRSAHGRRRGEYD